MTKLSISDEKLIYLFGYSIFPFFSCNSHPNAESDVETGSTSGILERGCFTMVTKETSPQNKWKRLHFNQNHERP